MRNPLVPWIKATGGDEASLLCERCRATHAIDFPQSVDAFVATLRAFNKTHSNCEESTV